MHLELNETVWYGTEASFYEALAAESAINARLQAGPFDEEDKDDYLLTKAGKVGVIQIRGPLVNSDHPLLRYFGVTGYPAIRSAVVAAAKDPGIEQILLAIDSGGGAVNGVTDTGDLIARVNAKVKPVTTLADGTMASAAYWLGVSASKVHSTKTSIVGSIGVLTVHIDRTKQLEEMGIKATVIRAGKYKALVNPFEKLSEAAEKQVQEQLDAAYRIFVQHVADSRGVSYEEADRKMAQGREFFGAAALDAGLVDSITTYDAVLAKLIDARPVDRKRAVYDNVISGDSMPKSKASLTEQEIAALASGAAALEAQAGETELSEEQKVAAEAAKLAADAPAAPAADAAAPADEAAAAPAAPAAPAESEVVKMLRAQLTESQDKIVAQAIELKAANDKLVTVEATHEALLGIARTSVSRLRVALGGSAGDADSLPAAQVVAEQARLSGEFQKKFKVGGVASVAPAVKEKEQGSVAAPSLHQARIAATRTK